MLPMLARYVAGRVPAAVVLRLGASSTAMWLPQLERCAVQFHSDAQLAQLAAGLEQAEAKGLRVLHISDSRSEAARTAAPAQLPTLAGLPQLERLVSWVHAGA